MKILSFLFLIHQKTVISPIQNWFIMNTYSIGIDIGGTNTDIGLVRDDGRVMAKKNLPTNKYFAADLDVSDIYDQIEWLIQDNSLDSIEGIGIAAPVGNYYTGCIENASNLNFKGIVDL